MKRKAIIFPYNAECASLVRNRELLLNHEIVACVSPIGYGLQGKDAAYAYGGENTGIVISDKKISEINFDDLLVCESSSDFDTFIMPQVKLAAECGFLQIGEWIQINYLSMKLYHYPFQWSL